MKQLANSFSHISTFCLHYYETEENLNETIENLKRREIQNGKRKKETPVTNLQI